MCSDQTENYRTLSYSAFDSFELNAMLSTCSAITRRPSASTDHDFSSLRSVLENSCRSMPLSHFDFTLIAPPGTSIATVLPSTLKSHFPRGSTKDTSVGV